LTESSVYSSRRLAVLYFGNSPVRLGLGKGR
jgi:hypothetical protein